jgi:hypothetical protein
MSTPASPFNPSRQVERIREILVGRQMAQVEHRLSRLEHHRAAAAPPGNRHAVPQPALRQVEEALADESRRRSEEVSKLGERIRQAFDDLQNRINACPPAAELDERLGSLRAELRGEQAQLHRDQQQESRERIAAVRDLASRISRLAAEQAKLREQSGGAAVARLRSAVEEWQQRTGRQLREREQWLISQLRAELERLRAETWHWLGELHRLKADKTRS